MQPSSISPVNLLVYAVEDSADYRFLLQQVFQMFLPEYTLHLFEDGQAFYQMLDILDKPGLLLLDFRMPVINGCELATLIRQRADWKYIPIIVMSNTREPDEIASCYKAGANSFLVKPTDIESMRQVMQSLCFYWFELNKPVVG